MFTDLNAIIAGIYKDYGANNKIKMIMAIIKGNIIIIGSNEELTPKKCEYCGKIEELRPYGINGANICFECAMNPENKANT